VKVLAHFVFSLVQPLSLFFAQLSASAVDMENLASTSPNGRDWIYESDFLWVERFEDAALQIHDVAVAR
jgi:hypothetical protein